MRTHETIIAETGGYQKLAPKIGQPKSRVRFWERRKRIPAAYWQILVDKRIASWRELSAQIADERGEAA